MKVLVQEDGVTKSERRTLNFIAGNDIVVTISDDPTGGQVDIQIDSTAAGGPGGGAPEDATYLVTTADATLSNEVVVGATPGGELGGTWASPTVDATHSGSTHAATQAAAEATAASALSDHTSDAADAHDASAISILDAANDFTATDVEGALAELQSDAEAHVAAADPHTGYVKENDASWVDLTDGGATILHSHAASGSDGSDHDVLDHADANTTPTPAAGDVLTWDDTPGEWVALAPVTGVTDHGALTGLGDDDHTQYVLHTAYDTHNLLHEFGGGAEIDLDDLGGMPAELTNHLDDAADAHDASAISVLDTAAQITATDVEGALAEIVDAAQAHEAAADPHTGYLKESDFDDVDFLVGTATGHTAAEIVVGTSPGGELGGTWASPTVDATHSGSSHAGVVSTHEAAGDPHTGYQLESGLQAVKFSVGALLEGSPPSNGFRMVWRAPFACTVTHVRGHIDAGTNAVINARKNQASDFMSADLTVDPADQWEEGTANQNTSIAAGDDIEIELVSTSGAVTQVNIQVDLTRIIPS